MGILWDIAENFMSADTVCFVINAATLGIMHKVYTSKYHNYEAVKVSTSYVSYLPSSLSPLLYDLFRVDHFS